MARQRSAAGGLTTAKKKKGGLQHPVSSKQRKNIIRRLLQSVRAAAAPHFAEIASDTGLHEQTIRRIYNHFMKGLPWGDVGRPTDPKHDPRLVARQIEELKVQYAAEQRAKGGVGTLSNRSCAKLLDIKWGTFARILKKIAALRSSDITFSRDPNFLKKLLRHTLRRSQSNEFPIEVDTQEMYDQESPRKLDQERRNTRTLAQRLQPTERLTSEMAAVRVRRWSDVEARRRPLHRAAYANSTPSPAPVAPASADPAPSVAKQVPLAVMEDAPECVICLDELALGRALFTAECGHRFHFSCLLENVNHDEANSDKCPICRKTQTQWPEQTEGLVKAHPYCTNCGKRGSGGQFCDGCGQSLAHTPTAQERARAAAAAAAARSNVVVECPTCRIRCLVSTTARGTLQCPNGHLFQLRMPPGMGNSQGLRQSFNGPGSMNSGPRPIMRQCPTCYTRVQMPPGSQAGQYMCPHGHTFYFSPFQ